MKRIIVITGDLASGKSTLADSLSKVLSIPCFKKDTIKEKYCDIYGYKTREENRALSIMATNYMIEAFSNFHPGKFPKVPGRRRGTRGFPAAPRQRPRI